MFHNYSLPHHPKYTAMSLVANPFISWHPWSWCITLLGFWAGTDVYHLGHTAPYLWAYKLPGSSAFPYVCSKSLRWYYCRISTYFVLTWFGSEQLRESFTCCKCRCLKQEPIIYSYEMLQWVYFGGGDRFCQCHWWKLNLKITFSLLDFTPVGAWNSDPFILVQ